MQHDPVSTLLAQDHARLAARLQDRPMRDLVLARLDYRSRFRGLILAAAAVLGAAIALVALVALAGTSGSAVEDLNFGIAVLAIAATIGTMGRGVTD